MEKIGHFYGFIRVYENTFKRLLSSIDFHSHLNDDDQQLAIQHTRNSKP
jgi:hypothetical protein